ncbi:hypothetical protein M433DRAFT_137701 [Acidomyces richmondensis BFW]|nr:hypothetical protein M433DRAFT_137701 [Acidomyces richmondensis BFW]
MVYRYRKGSTVGELFGSCEINSSDINSRSFTHYHPRDRHSSLESVTSVFSGSAYSRYSSSQRDRPYAGSKPDQSRPATGMPPPDYFSSGKSRDCSYRSPDIAGGYSDPVAKLRYAMSKDDSQLASNTKHAKTHGGSRWYYDNDIESLYPDDSISQAGKRRSKRASQYCSSFSMIYPRKEMHFYKLGNGSNIKPRNLEPMPEEDARAFRAETGFGEDDIPYYDSANDHGCGNYVLDLKPESDRKEDYEIDRHWCRVGSKV